MKHYTRITVFVFLAVSVGIGCRGINSPLPEASPQTTVTESPLPYYADDNFTPHWYDTPEEVPEDFHTIPAFALINQEGRTITEANLNGRITIANFFFTACPGICPMTTANMRRVQDTFADDDRVVMLSHSVTPNADSVAALRAFAEKTGVLAERWHLVTGARAEIYRLGKDAYFADEDLGETSNTIETAFTHTESFYLLDGKRRIRGIYNGLNTTAISRLIDDASILRQEQN